MELKKILTIKLMFHYQVRQGESHLFFNDEREDIRN